MDPRLVSSSPTLVETFFLSKTIYQALVSMNAVDVKKTPIQRRQATAQTYTYTLSYYHHQIGSMNYYPLFRVRSWNNGMRCMSFYILTDFLSIRDTEKFLNDILLKIKPFYWRKWYLNALSAKYRRLCPGLLDVLIKQWLAGLPRCVMWAHCRQRLNGVDCFTVIACL